MNKTMLTPRRLETVLNGNGFQLLEVRTSIWPKSANDRSVTKDFVRDSLLSHLYEHLVFRWPMGLKNGCNVYALISATRLSWQDQKNLPQSCLIEDVNPEKPWIHVKSFGESNSWERTLVDLSDSLQKFASQNGTALLERLNPALQSVERYLEKLGNICAIFGREFAYITEHSEVQRKEAERLVFGSNLGGDLGADALLACLALVRFGPEVEDVADAFFGKKPHLDPDLFARIYVLTDLIHMKRQELRNVAPPINAVQMET